MVAKRMVSLVIGAVVVLVSCAGAMAGAFTPGDLVVTSIGSSAADGAAASVTLNEYNVTSKTVVNSIAMPSTFTLPNDATANEAGHLTLSANGNCLLIAGYTATVGTATVAALDPSVAPRTVGVIYADGTTNVSTQLTDAGAWPIGSDGAKYLRGVASVDGTQFWLAGDGSANNYPAGGLRYTTLGSNTTVAVNQPNTVPGTTYVNVRSAAIYGGQLYVTSGSGSVGKGVHTVGTGLPTSGTPTFPLVAVDKSNNSVNQMLMFDLNGDGVNDTMYVMSKGGLEKFALVGSTWTQLTGTVGVGEQQNLAALQTANGVELFVGGYNTIWTVTDTNGYNQAFSTTAYSTYLTAGPNEQFGGISFTPTPEPVTMSLLAIGGLLISRRRKA